MAIKKTWDLHVTFVILSEIETYDGFKDEVVDRLVSTFGGEEMGGAFEPVTVHCDGTDCAAKHEVQGRVLDFSFTEKDEAFQAAKALQELSGVVGVYLHWVVEDDQYPEDDDRRFEFAEDLEYDWARCPAKTESTAETGPLN